MIEKINKDLKDNLKKYNQQLLDMTAQEILIWGYEKFGNQFAITTSFGIQSSVLLNILSQSGLQKKNQNLLDRYRLLTSRNISLRSKAY